MAKKASTKTTSSNAEVTEQKNRKQQAKREAKMMLEIEQAKVSIEKAEKKLAKTQARLEARNAHLRTLEADLSEFRTTHEETEEATGVSDQNGDTDQRTQQPLSKDDEATIIPAIGSNHQTEQPEEITSSNE